MMNEQNKIDPVLAFPEVEKTLYQIAWDFHRTTRLTFDEAKSEVYWAFMKVCENFDPSKGMKFNSWCYIKIRWHMKTHVTRLARDPLMPCEKPEEVFRIALQEAPKKNGKAISSLTAAPTRSECLEMVDDLSGDAKELLSLLLETPKDILDSLPITPMELLQRAKEYLGWQKGVAEHDLEFAAWELKSRFEEAWAR